MKAIAFGLLLTKMFYFLFVAAVFVSAWVTHLTHASPSSLLYWIGALIPPIGGAHGFMIWFGAV